MRYRTLALGTLSLSLFATSAHASAEICDGVDNDGDGLVDNHDPDLPSLCDASPDLRFGRTEHDVVVRFSEPSLTVTSADVIAVDQLVMVADVGETIAGTTTPDAAVQLPPGSYNSTLLHFDVDTSDSTTGTFTADFSGERVVALVYTNHADDDGLQRLVESDAVFGASGATYASSQYRGLGTNDSITVDALDQLSVSFTVKGGADNLRVITCDDADENGVCDTIDADSDGDGSSFDPADCDGLAGWQAGWFEATDGTLFDISDELSSADGRYTFSADGTVWLCDDDYDLYIYNNGYDASVRGMGAEQTTVTGRGGSIFQAADGALDIQSLAATGGSNTYGGGVYAVDSDLSFSDVAFHGNQASSAGGAVYASSSDGTHSVDVSGGAFYDNSAPRGGAFMLSQVDVTIDGTEVYSNSASSNAGGGLYAYGASGSVTITDAAFSDNHASNFGGGLLLSAVGSVVMDSVDVYDNTSGMYGGGLHIINSDADLTTVDFWGNSDGTIADDMTVSLTDSAYDVVGSNMGFGTGDDIVLLGTSSGAYDFISGAGFACNAATGCAARR